MRKLVASVLCVGLLAAANLVAAPSATAQAADVVLFVGGGTPLTNGLFFPGTAIYDEASKEFIGEPLAVPKGSNINLVNVDAGAVANGHGIRSFKLRKGRPLFASKIIDGPAQELVITSHLKPGVYAYGCPVHFGMYGLIEVQ